MTRDFARLLDTANAPEMPSGAMEILVLKNRLTQRYGTVNVVIDSNSERIRNGVRSSAERTHRRDLE